MPFVAHVWALTDPETEVAIAPFAIVPDQVMAHLPGIVRHRYLTAINRWDTMDASVDSLHRATAGDLSRSLVHREFLGPNGIGDVASIVFRDRFGCWGFLDLWRSVNDPPFADTDLAILAEDVAAITDTLRRCQARSFDEPSAATKVPGPAVLFLSPHLQVLGQTPDTDAYLRALLPTHADREPVPAGAYNVAAALLASEAGGFDHPPMARVCPVGGTWLTFRAARIDAERQPADRDIAVTIEVTAPADRRSLYARTHGLSPRETELIELLANGDDTGQLGSPASAPPTLERSEPWSSATRLDDQPPPREHGHGATRHAGRSFVRAPPVEEVQWRAQALRPPHSVRPDFVTVTLSGPPGQGQSLPGWM